MVTSGSTLPRGLLRVVRDREGGIGDKVDRSCQDRMVFDVGEGAQPCSTLSDEVHG